MLCQKEKHKGCLLCESGGRKIGSEANSLISKEIGPALAKEAGVTKETGLESFIGSLQSSRSTLQENLRKIAGLDCFMPTRW